MFTVTEEVGGRSISIETGRMARQASGSVVVRYGDTVVLVTATSDSKPKDNLNFLPLAVHYVETLYAAGRVPGGFFQREGPLPDRVRRGAQPGAAGGSGAKPGTTSARSSPCPGTAFTWSPISSTSTHGCSMSATAPWTCALGSCGNTIAPTASPSERRSSTTLTPSARGGCSSSM